MYKRRCQHSTATDTESTTHATSHAYTCASSSRSRTHLRKHARTHGDTMSHMNTGASHTSSSSSHTYKHTHTHTYKHTHLRTQIRVLANTQARNTCPQIGLCTSHPRRCYWEAETASQCSPADHSPWRERSNSGCRKSSRQTEPYRKILHTRT
jgi:hypothetical protein